MLNENNEKQWRKNYQNNKDFKSCYFLIRLFYSYIIFYNYNKNWSLENTIDLELILVLNF